MTDAVRTDATPRTTGRGATSVYARIMRVIIGVLVLCGGGAGYTVFAMNAISGNAERLVTIERDVGALHEDAEKGLLRAQILLAALQDPLSDSARDTLTAEQAANDAAVQAAVDRFDTAAVPGTAEGWETFATTWGEWVRLRDEALLADDGARSSTEGKAEAASLADEATATLAAVGTVIDEHTSSSAAASSARAERAVFILGGGIAVVIAVALVVGRRLARSIRDAVETVRRSLVDLAAGDLTNDPRLDSRDEIGQMADALTTAQRNLRALVGEVAATASAVATSAEALAASAHEVTSGAQETAAQSGVAASASQQVSQNVQTVAAGAEQMGASIREIAHNATEAAKVAGEATEVAASTNATITRLGASSQEIGDVIKVITSIAEQTNLLALNATIEAARAGEAGKGFAVVASEVKELAQESATAAEDIGRRVEAIQGDTGGAVNAIAQISEVIARINDYQMTIASAVEEQTATTNEMSRGVAEAATGTGEITGTITGIARSTADSTETLGHMSDAVADLARRSGDLQASLRRFTV